MYFASNKKNTVDPLTIKRQNTYVRRLKPTQIGGGPRTYRSCGVNDIK